MYSALLVFLIAFVLVTQARNYNTNPEPCCLQSQEILKYINDLSNMANSLSNQADILKRSIVSMPSMLRECNRPINRVYATRAYATRSPTLRPTYNPRYNNRYMADRDPRTRYRTVKSSCKEWFEYNRYLNNGEMFMIDPFKTGRSVAVKCVFTNNQIITEIEPKPVRPRDQVYEGNQQCYSKTDSIPGEHDYCEERVIQYALSREDIFRVMHVSGKCSQKIVWGCHGHNILYAVTGSGTWNVYGVKLTSDDPYYKQGRCDCGINDNCSQSNLSCECSAERDQWATDYITIHAGENNQNLPVRTIAVGDLDGQRERAQIMVEKIVCSYPMNDEEEIIELLNGEEETTITQAETTPAVPADVVTEDTVAQN